MTQERARGAAEVVHRHDLVGCHDCGVLHLKSPLAPRARALCARCRAVLYRGHGPDAARELERAVAILLGALLVWLIAQFFPIIELDLNGQRIAATLVGAIGVLWHEHMQVIATMVFLFAIVFPLVEVGALLYLAAGLRARRVLPGFHPLLRGVRTARRWGMTEVLMLGIMVTAIKMLSLARVVPQPGVFAFAVLTVMMAVAARIDPRSLWNLADTLAPATPAGGRAGGVVLPAQAGRLVACHACGLVNDAPAAHAHGKAACLRCHAALHRRRPDSIRRTWALLVSAVILYIPANLLPVMYTSSLLGSGGDTILSGVALFWHSGSPGLAALIFVASIMVPVLKLVVLALLAWTAQRRSRWRPRQRTTLYRIVEFIGRWSMLDIFVVTLTVALVRFQSLAVITAGPGAFAFGAVVVLTMLASTQFDPRLIWDSFEFNGEEEHV
jgi:paraquat-inducible protein A